MNLRALTWIKCSVCGGALRPLPEPPTGNLADGQLACDKGHLFAVRSGVPSLRPEDALVGVEGHSPANAIAESFSSEWEHFDYDASRTWHATVEERRELFLKEMDLSPEELQGKVLLDAGCGNGTLSEGVARFGCEVLAIDVSNSVFAAERYFSRNGCGRTHFIRGSLLDLPVRRHSVDLIYSSGVLHHNPDTLEALQAIMGALKPGGKIYIWVYHREADLKFRLQLVLRRIIAPLPMPLKQLFIYVWSIQAMIRQYLRTLAGSNDPEDRLTWKERVVDLMDIYTPRYRWMHTQGEVHGWYRDLGLVDVKTTEVRQWGFGVAGTAPN